MEQPQRDPAAVLVDEQHFDGVSSVQTAIALLKNTGRVPPSRPGCADPARQSTRCVTARSRSPQGPALQTVSFPGLCLAKPYARRVQVTWQRVHWTE